MSIPGDPQHNPYAQPSGPPNPYAQPVGGYATPGPPGPGMPPGPLGPPQPAPRRPVPGWLWGLSGALLASAVWAAAVIVSGGLHSEPEADLAGYHYHEDMCEVLDTSALRDHYNEDTRREPTGYHSRHEALDASQCGVRFKAPNARTYDTTYVNFQVAWHKKTDPAGEFAARMQAYESRSSDLASYSVEEVEGLGDEAYLITDRGKRDDRLRWAMLAVRDGWVETTMDWSEISAASSTDRMTKERLEKMLTSDTRATLEALRKPAEESSGNDSRGEGDI